MADAQKKEEAKDAKAPAEGAPAEAAGGGGGGKKKLIIIIAGALVVLLGGGAGAFFMLKGGGDKHAEGGDEHGGGEHGAAEGGHGEAKSDAHGKAEGGHGEAKGDAHGEAKKEAGHGETKKEDAHGGGEKKAEGGHGEAKKEDAHGGGEKKDAHGKAEGGHGEAKEGAAKNGEETADDGSGFGATYAFKPFHLNLGNPLDNHYVRLEVALEYKGGDTQKQEIEKRLVQLRDAIVSVASRKTREFLLGPDGKDQLRREILIRINRYMTKPIESVFITDILIE